MYYGIKIEIWTCRFTSTPLNTARNTDIDSKLKTIDKLLGERGKTVFHCNFPVNLVSRFFILRVLVCPDRLQTHCYPNSSEASVKTYYVEPPLLYIRWADLKILIIFRWNFLSQTESRCSWYVQAILCCVCDLYQIFVGFFCGVFFQTPLKEKISTALFRLLNKSLLLLLLQLTIFKGLKWPTIHFVHRMSPSNENRN